MKMNNSFIKIVSCVFFIVSSATPALIHAAEAHVESAVGSLFDVEKAPHGFIISFPQSPSQQSKQIIKDQDELRQWFVEVQYDIISVENKMWPHLATRNAELNKVAEKSKANVLQEADLRALHQTFIDLTDQHPLMLCYECGSTEGGKSSCTLARKVDSQKCERDMFMQRLLAATQTPDQLPKKGIIFYGPGGCMFEVQVLTTLLKKNASFKHVYFIEPAWDLTYEVMKDFDEVHGQGKPLVGISDHHLLSAQRLVQIAHFVWALNPTIKFHIYGDHNAYRADLAKNNELRADGLVAMDATDSVASQDVIRVEKELRALLGSLWDNSLVATTYKSAVNKLKSEMKRTIKACAGCAKTDVKLMTCGKCKSVFYCSTDCQRAHWLTHKCECLPINQ